MGTKWEQSGNKNSNGNKMGTRTPKWDKSGNKMGIKWDQEHQSETRMQEWEENGNKMETRTPK